MRAAAFLSPRGLIGASILAMGAFGAVASAFAQEAPAAAPGESDQALGDIIVTARKVDERLQDVPVSVTVFSGEQLQTYNVTNVHDVAAFTPGLVPRDYPAAPSAFGLALRGQVQSAELATLDPSVGAYVDGAYWARSYGLNGDLLDVNAVEVLKGPQGTLFGRNTPAGALVIRTNDPSTDAISGTLQASYGRFNERVGTAILNVPLGEMAAIRGAFQINKRDGYVTDRITGFKYQNRDNLTGRVKLLVKPTDNVRIILSGERFEFDQDNGRAITLALPGARGNGTAIFYPNTVAEAAANLANIDTITVGVAPFFPHAANVPYLYPNADRSFAAARTQTYNATIAVDTGFGEVKWINSYRKVKIDNLINASGTLEPISLTTFDQDLKQRSSELQMTGKFGSVDFAFGAVYLHESGFDRSLNNNISATSPGAVVQRFLGTIDNDSFGMYGQASYHITDQLTATGGLRYSIDDKGVKTETGVLNRVPLPNGVGGLIPVGTLISCITPDRSVATGCVNRRNDTFKAVSYTVGLDYKISDDVLIYAKQSRGYRSGGQQLRTLSGSDTAPFQPEVVNEQEIGFKAEFLDRRVRLNVAAYHNTITDAQRSVITSVNGQARTVVENADLRNFGAEAELTAKVAAGLILSATASHNDPKYTRYVGVIGITQGQDKTDSRFDGLAKNQFTLAGNYSSDIGFGKLGVNVNYIWVSEYATGSESARQLILVGNTAAQAAAIIDRTRKPAAGFLGARASLGIGDHFEVAVWGRNILDRRVFVQNVLVTDYVSGIRNDPATYGVTGTVKF